MSATQIKESIWMDTPPIQESDLKMPQWYLDFQKASWERFSSLPVPTRNDEDWRYADLKKSRFEKLYPVKSRTVPRAVTGKVKEGNLEHTSAHFAFVNGELAESDTSSLPGEVVCKPINLAISESGDEFRSYFDVDATRLGDEKFAALNGSASIYGIFVHVPKGVEVDGPIVVHHLISGDSAPVFPRTLVVAEDNSSISVVEHFESIDDETPGLSIGICDLHANHGGKIAHSLVQNLNEFSKQVHLGSSNSGRDSSIQSVVVNLGGAWIRNESINRMTASGANTRIYGANLANGLEEYDQRTLQIHDAQYTTSDLLIKNALYDKSRVIFGGLIQVLPGAHHTDSFQSSRSLLGSNEAEVSAMPGLEIDADQVSCSHGATSGQISEEEIFYLRSRGIPSVEAKRIVSCGFLAEALEKIENRELFEWLCRLIEEKIYRI